MDNNTVALSVVEDLIHWPLPPAAPTEVDVAATGAAQGSNISGEFTGEALFLQRDDAPLTAGAVEELDEEPQERKQARYEAVRRLPTLAQAMGPQWAKTEIVPYVLRCVEEEDAELSFAVGMTLIDFSTSTFTCATRVEKLFTDGGRPLSLKNLLPVLVRIGASTDAGVRLFLVEVVIPMLFFGVPLERSLDLRDWREKYLNVRSCDGETGEEPRITFDANNNYANGGDASGAGGRRMSSGSRGMGGGSTSSSSSTGNKASDNAWDPFRINLYANRLRSAIATYLRDITTDGGETDSGAEPLMASCGKTMLRHEYSDRRDRREAFRARWGLFVGLMESMLKSEYPATVSAAVECIGNVFSCITWVERAERQQEKPSATPFLRSTEELVVFTFTATRSHVGRAICSGSEKPCEDLIMLLVDHHLLSEGAAAVTAAFPPGSGASDRHGCVTLGCGGLGVVEREAWSLCTGGRAPAMHRVVRMSLLRALPQFIDWASATAPGSATAETELLGGLSFYDVCDVFSRALTAPMLSAAERNSGGSKWGKKESSAGNASAGDVALLLESDVCHDFGVAEAFLDGVQHLLDELLRPNTIEDFLQRRERSSRLAMTEKKARLLRLCRLYGDCVVQMVALPSWKTRWLTTQRLPSLTASLAELLHRVGSHDASDGRVLVETCVAFLCNLHVSQWTSSSEEEEARPQRQEEGEGNMMELVHDDEEEVRTVVAVCAAGVFRALGQGMFRLVFPHGVVVDLCHGPYAKTQMCGDATQSRGRYVDPNSNKYNINKPGGGGDALLSDKALLQYLPPLLEAVLRCCETVLQDPEERVRAGAAAGLSALARTLSTMITACDLHVRDLGKATWLRYLDRTTASLMTLLNDSSATVQLTLVSELAALLTSSAAEAGRLAATMGGSGSRHANRQCDAAHVRESALVVCLQTLARHEVWRYRERYARLLSEMCVKFLAPNSLAAAEAVSQASHEVHTLEASVRESSVAGGRPSGVVMAEDGVNPLHRFAKDGLLPLLVDVLFDKVKAVRDSALESLVQMCNRLSAARLQLQAASTNGNACGSGGVAGVGVGGLGGEGSGGIRQRHSSTSDDDVFINDTLWPLIVGSPKAMATYLSRSSLLRIAVRLGVDKESILLPLLDHLGHDSVLNVRLVVAKELFSILAGSSASTSPSTAGTAKVTFTEQEKNGVVLQLLRLLVEDKSADVRDEAARALKLCF